MNKQLKIIFYIGLFLFFIAVASAEARAQAGESMAKGVPAPTLIAPNEKTATGNLKPLITGLTKDNTTVEFFIDGIYDGGTGILRDLSGTANFAYQPSKNLSRGWHTILAKAFDDQGLSLTSNILNFKIELPLPAPTMFKPVVNQNTSASQPFIVGLAKNDSKIKIYIDKKYSGELTVKNHPSGTANFAYKPVVALARGAHSVYTVAVDKRGKESVWSNTVNFFIKSAAIAQSAQEEKKPAVAKIVEPSRQAEIKSEPVVISPSSGAVIKKPIPGPTNQPQALAPDDNLTAKEKAIKQELKDKEKAALEKLESLIGADAQEVKSDRGTINEGKRSQSRLNLDLILFILFLIGVVAWLIWVNREMVKERRAQTEDAEMAEAKPDKIAEENKNQPISRGRDNKLL